jgi:hypothetical protein
VVKEDKTSAMKNELGFLSDDSPLSYDFANRRVPLDIYHHSPVIVRVVNQTWFGYLSSDASQSLAYKPIRLLAGHAFHSRVPPRRC